jgi:hypothetical protein
MVEFLIVAGIAGGVVGAVAGGISFGSRYVEAKLRYEEKEVRLDQPILAPSRSHRMGEDRAA